MSYPDRRYFGDRGAVLASFRPASTTADLIAPSGDRTSFLATSSSTGGEYGLYRVDMQPGSTGPEPHFHRTISEAFFILSGHVELFDGNRWRSAGIGDFFYVPVGGLHAFRNASDCPSSMIMVFAPGAAMREKYFEEMTEMMHLGGDLLRRFREQHDGYYADQGTWG